MAKTLGGKDPPKPSNSIPETAQDATIEDPQKFLEGKHHPLPLIKFALQNWLF